MKTEAGTRNPVTGRGILRSGTRIVAIAAFLLVALTGFMRLHSFFLTDLDWSVIMMMRSAETGWPPVAILHPILITLLRGINLLEGITSGYTALAFFYGTFHFASVSITGLIAWRLSKRLWVAMLAAAIYSVHPCTQFLLGSFEDNVLTHPFLLLAILFALDSNPDRRTSTIGSGAAFACALMFGVSSLLLAPIIVSLNATAFGATFAPRTMLRRCVQVGLSTVVTLIALLFVNDLLNGFAPGRSIQTLAGAAGFAGQWVQETNASDRFLRFERSIGGFRFEANISPLEFFLMSPAQVIYSCIILWPDWPDMFTGYMVTTDALIYVSTKKYARYLIGLGLWFHVGQVIVLGLVALLRARARHTADLIVVVAVIAQLVFASGFLHFYRDVPYERYDYYVLLLPLLAFTLRDLNFSLFERRIPIGRALVSLFAIAFFIGAVSFLNRFQERSIVHTAFQNHRGSAEAYYFSRHEIDHLVVYTGYKMAGHTPLHIVETEIDHSKVHSVPTHFEITSVWMTPAQVRALEQDSSVYVSPLILRPQLDPSDSP